VLSARLRSLEDKGVVVRRVAATTPPSYEYALSDLGEELVPVILAIIEVGARLKLRQAVAPLAAERGRKRRVGLARAQRPNAVSLESRTAR
jgi:DNA-binding HxlR family transcriptional regulator